jgi:amino acid permease
MLGVIAALFAVGWVALMAVADSFRRSFGASPKGALVGVLPVVVAVVVLASLCWPGSRALLHVTAVLVAALVVACVLLARAAPFVATLGLAYAAAWLAFYWRAAWRG